MKKKVKEQVDVHDDDLMRKLGFDRPNLQSPRDNSVWTKTTNERRILNNVKRKSKKYDMHFHLSPVKQSSVYDKLIIQLKKNKIFPNTTYSRKCFDSQIPDFLDRFIVTNPKTGASESLVLKYSFNGKTHYVCV